MFGLVLVEPQEGLPPVDKEFYVMQSDLYVCDSGEKGDNELIVDFDAATSETPKYVFFNGKEGALIERPLMVKQDERVRLFVGNAGPNLISSFHVIGAIL
jgi:nitrite reductase (NO-forming)